MKLDLNIEYDRERAKMYFQKLLDMDCKIEIKKLAVSRTLKHNAYLHVCISLFAIDFGYTIDEAKIILKRQCSFMTYRKGKSIFLKKTSKMKSDELTKFVDFIREFAAKHSCYIPTSEEYLTNKFSIDKTIDNHRKHI